ncbi:MAG: HAD family hydrolase [Gemmatimonadetes bacterium]|nr:HAD family hydrolase [Gemmatimonadota bacterium]
MLSHALKAVIWDFDNTLVDTRARNRSVTRRIIETVTDRAADEFHVLSEQRLYDSAIYRWQNWQDLYRVEFELSQDQIRAAGRLWTGYQAEDSTPTRWFEGIAEVVRRLADWPQAIVSMNTSDNIRAALGHADLGDHFRLVVGCDDVAYERQKPDADGLLHCLDTLTEDEEGTVLYVGDHPVDAQCAANANRELDRRGAALRVVAIGAAYGADAPLDGWPVAPDFQAHAPDDVLAIAGISEPPAT